MYFVFPRSALTNWDCWDGGRGLDFFRPDAPQLTIHGKTGGNNWEAQWAQTPQ